MGFTSMRSRSAVMAVAVLALALTAAACSDAASTATTAAEPATTEAAVEPLQIDISGFAFGPADVTVPAGTTVTWTNLDGAPHKVVSDDGVWQSETLEDGDSFSFTLDTPGTYPYHCSIHPSMQATITVEG